MSTNILTVKAVQLDDKNVNIAITENQNVPPKLRYTSVLNFVNVYLSNLTRQAKASGEDTSIQAVKNTFIRDLLNSDATLKEIPLPKAPPQP